MTKDTDYKKVEGLVDEFFPLVKEAEINLSVFYPEETTINLKFLDHSKITFRAIENEALEDLFVAVLLDKLLSPQQDFSGEISYESDYVNITYKELCRYINIADYLERVHFAKTSDIWLTTFKSLMLSVAFVAKTGCDFHVSIYFIDNSQIYINQKEQPKKFTDYLIKFLHEEKAAITVYSRESEEKNVTFYRYFSDYSQNINSFVYSLIAEE